MKKALTLARIAKKVSHLHRMAGLIVDQTNDGAESPLSELISGR